MFDVLDTVDLSFCFRIFFPISLFFRVLTFCLKASKLYESWCLLLAFFWAWS